MKLFKLILPVLIFISLPKFVLADSLDGLSIIEDMIYILGVIVVVGIFFQIINLFSESKSLNYFSNVFCIVLILLGIMAGGGELGINVLPAAISVLLIILKRLLRKN